MEDPDTTFEPATAAWPRILYPSSWAAAWFDIDETPLAVFAITGELVVYDTIFATFEILLAV